MLPFALLIKPVFHLRIFSYEATFAEFSLVSNFFRSEKIKRSNPTFYYFRTKNVASYEKIRKRKTSVKIKYVNKNFVNFIQISRFPHLTLKLWNDAEQTFKCKWPYILRSNTFFYCEWRFIFHLYFPNQIEFNCKSNRAWSLVVPLIVTRCHSMYHSLSLYVPLVCLFINSHSGTSSDNEWYNEW